jgi:indolepyruvate ferredoxin oxidoreductase, beta subunit
MGKAKQDKVFRIVLAGVGGQGSVTAGRLLGEGALADGKPVMTSEVHGMSQRGGIVDSTVVIGPVKSALVGKGQANVLLAFEPVEALRSLGYASKKTVAVVNTAKIVPFAVTMDMAEYPDVKQSIKLLEDSVGRVVAIDAVKLAEKAGSAKALNSVLIGALSATGVLPIDPDTLRKTVLSMVPKKFLKENEKAYALGEKAGRK